MLVNGDYKGLEVEGAAYLSKDPVLTEELLSGKDIHSDNQQRFDLPARVVAKIFFFRLIYGGSAYSYAFDPDFNYISDNPKYWQGIIDATYDKYKGLAAWHESLMTTVMDTGQLVLPTGRKFVFEPYLKRGELVWPRTKILNYPVQGLGADLMTIVRVSLWSRLRTFFPQAFMIGTVHDSILIDVATQDSPSVARLYFEVWNDLPSNFEKLFGVPYNLTPKVEVQIGPNWHDMEDFKP